MEKIKIRSLDRYSIKYIALFAMLLDHISHVFFMDGTYIKELCNGIGNFTAVTMIYFLVEGYHYTHSKRNYIIQLLLFATISQIPFSLALTKDSYISFFGLNMFFSLCICFAIVWTVENIDNKIIKYILIFCYFIMSCFCDWYYFAPVFTLLFLWADKSKKRLLISYSIITIFLTFSQYIEMINEYSIIKNIVYSITDDIGIIASAFFIIFLYNGKETKRKKNKWFFYFFYPVHLTIIGLLRLLIL